MCLLALLVVGSIIGGGSVHGCTVPCAVLIGSFAAVLGVELYLESPKRVIGVVLIDQELEWLLGKDKVKSVTPLEFVFAQEQIRRRRSARWRSVMLSIPFLGLFAILVLIGFSFTKYGEQEAALIALVFALGLLLLPLIIMLSSFPTRTTLARREPHALATIAREVQTQYGAKMKPDTWYRLSYDGELIEVLETEALRGKFHSFKVGKESPAIEDDELR